MICAMEAAPAAIPPKPKMAAMIAIRKKASTRRSIGIDFWLIIHSDVGQAGLGGPPASTAGPLLQPAPDAINDPEKGKDVTNIKQKHADFVELSG
jgi:hypothetical protein